jgi:hypothetical protein
MKYLASERLCRHGLIVAYGPIFTIGEESARYVRVAQERDERDCEIRIIARDIEAGGEVRPKDMIIRGNL